MSTCIIAMHVQVGDGGSQSLLHHNGPSLSSLVVVVLKFPKSKDLSSFGQSGSVVYTPLHCPYASLLSPVNYLPTYLLFHVYTLPLRTYIHVCICVFCLYVCVYFVWATPRRIWKLSLFLCLIRFQSIFLSF